MDLEAIAKLLYSDLDIGCGCCASFGARKENITTIVEVLKKVYEQGHGRAA